MKMRMEIQQLLFEQPELRQFIRQNPSWYRTLNRYPEEVPQLIKEANYFYGRTLPQRVEKMQNQLGLVMTIIEMLKMGQNTVEQTQGLVNPGP